jgi:NADH:flavin oxidoreductase / NADH oxidase family
MSSLFEPLKLGSVTIPNRIGMSSMTRNRALNTIPTDLMAQYYAQRAAGGASLIVTEGTLITRQGFVDFLVLLMFILNCLFSARNGPLRLVSGIRIRLQDGRRSQMPYIARGLLSTLRLVIITLLFRIVY